jgi:hypothetical protein
MVIIEQLMYFNNRKTNLMKNLTTIFAALLLFFVSCKKQTNDEQNNVTNSLESSNKAMVTEESNNIVCGQARIVKLLAGQSTQVGIISISNDQTNIYIKYITTNGWQIQKTHLYVGAEEKIPTFLTGNIQVGSFTYQTEHSPRVTSFTYSIPLDELNECYSIAAHAEVVRIDENNAVLETETGWGQGKLVIGNNWAMIMNYCTQINTSSKINVGDFCTQTQEGWGIDPQGNNPGAYMQANFASAFSNGMLLGCASEFKVTLMSPQAVTSFLPERGSPGVLPKSYINPVTVNNKLAGEVAALSLSVMFDAYDLTFCSSPNALSTLVIKTGTFQGWTVGQVLAESNKVLGGCFSVYTPSQLNDVLISINENFENGTVDKGFLISN